MVTNELGGESKTLKAADRSIDDET